MKKIGVLFCVILCVLLVGCRNKKEIIETLPIGKETFFYEGLGKINRIAVDDEGFLYTISATRRNEISHSMIQTVCVYDLEGNCVENVEIEAGNSTVFDMFLQEEFLYFSCGVPVENKSSVALFRINVFTWEVTQLGVLDNFYYIQDMVLIGDYMYFLGKSFAAEEKNIIPDASLPWNISYSGEQIGRINIHKENAKTELMNGEMPLCIYKTPQDTLVMFCYTESNAFVFFEFDPKQDTLNEVDWESGEPNMRKLTACEDGFLFSREGKLFYGTLAGVEAELLPDSIHLACKPVYQKGFVFFIKGDHVERLYIADIIQKEKVVRILMHNDTQDKPFGCGYQMKKTVRSADEFALKVLAQDTDYDIYLLSSRQSCSYNLKNKGTFYPLNKVESVQEYLDACFPYVKELAINDEGEIWMLPVALAIPAVVYNKDFCEEQEINLAEMDFFELVSFTKEIEREQPEKTSWSLHCTIEELFAQYLYSYETFDTALFRIYAEAIFDVCNEQGAWMFDTGISDNVSSGAIPEFYYDYCIYLDSLQHYAERLGDSDAIKVIGTPKIEGNTRNLGTISFLAVNPQSENLDAALEYISTYAEYMLEQKNMFLWKDKSIYQDIPFYNDLYNLYSNGTIYFAMEREVYWNTFNDYLEGNIDLETAITEMERRRKLYLEE